jgi:integrase
VIPVHSRVLRSGLLAYLAGLSPGGLLFPTLTPGGPDSKLSWRISPAFTRLRRQLGITRDRVSFHSLRKSVGTKLEQGRVPESEAVQLLGHEKLSMSYRVYSLGVDLKRLKEIVELVRYDGAEA